MGKKILFIADGYAVGNDVGSIFYQKLLVSVGIHRFCYYGIGSLTHLSWPSEFASMPKKFSTLRIWQKTVFRNYLKRIPFIEEIFYFLLLPFVVRKVRKFISDNDVDLIIAVFRADVLAIINKINLGKNIPVLGYISDTVEAEYCDKYLIYKYKKKQYYKAIQIASGIYVAGESMEVYIKKKFHKETSILRMGFENSLKFDRDSSKTKDEIKVFFSGSVYAPKEFELFISALSVIACKYSEYKISFMTATSYIEKTRPYNVSIIRLGWLKEQELKNKMQDACIGYVPYKFDELSAMQMTYAFPSKAGFYLSAGLPIFFHGPDYSSMKLLLKKYTCGIHCTSMNLDDIVADLEKMLFDSQFYDYCKNASLKAYNNEFSMKVMTDNFNKLIDKHTRLEEKY